MKRKTYEQTLSEKMAPVTIACSDLRLRIKSAGSGRACLRIQNYIYVVISYTYTLFKFSVNICFALSLQLPYSGRPRTETETRLITNTLRRLFLCQPAGWFGVLEKLQLSSVALVLCLDVPKWRNLNECAPLSCSFCDSYILVLCAAFDQKFSPPHQPRRFISD